jgi:hypothetical protein
VKLVPDVEAVIDSGSTFRLELSTGSADARLLLLDASDALVAASGTHEVGAATRLTLSPSAPLRPASKLALRIDGATTRELHDAAGAAYGPVTFPILVAGSPPPPEEKPKAKPQRKKRRR